MIYRFLRSLCMRYILAVSLCTFHADVNFSCRATLRYPPRNVAVVSQSDVVLKCASGFHRAADWLQWLEYISDPVGRVIVDGDVVVHASYPPRYVVRVRDDISMLFIADADYIDSGRYACVNKENNDTGYAEVVILHSAPSCRSNSSVLGIIENEYLQFTCAVNYTGRWAPVMSWSSVNHGFHAHDVVSKDNRTVPGMALYMFTFRAREMYSGREFVVAVFFDQPRRITTQYESSFIPEYKYYHTSAPLNVLYGPRDVKIIPRKRVYVPGAMVLIRARANPSPQYMWIDVATNVTIHSRVLRIDLSMLGAQSYVAVVSNRMLGVVAIHKERINFTVKWYTTSRAAPLWGIVLGVTMLGTVCIAIAYLMIIAGGNGLFSLLTRIGRTTVGRFGIHRRGSPIENGTLDGGSLPAITTEAGLRSVEVRSQSVEGEPTQLSDVTTREDRMTEEEALPEEDEEEDEGGRIVVDTSDYSGSYSVGVRR